jgi:hypothetical protein
MTLVKTLTFALLAIAPLCAFAGVQSGPNPGVPLPGVLTLMAIGAAGMALARRRR